MSDDAPETEAVILIKGAGQPSKNPQQLVYGAGITPSGQWLRLAPLSFLRDDDARQYKRWDRVRFALNPTQDDARSESRTIKPQSLEIIGELVQNDRRAFISALEVTSLTAPALQGKTLALLRPSNPQFSIKPKTPEDIAEERASYDLIVQTAKAANPYLTVKPQQIFPFKFHYSYGTDDGTVDTVYRDWEMSATFANLTTSFGEAQTVARAIQVFGRDYPRKGVMFAMSRPTPSSTAWEINSVIGMDELASVAEGSLNLTA